MPCILHGNLTVRIYNFIPCKGDWLGHTSMCDLEHPHLSQIVPPTSKLLNTVKRGQAIFTRAWKPVQLRSFAARSRSDGSIRLSRVAAHREPATEKLEACHVQ
jgi:hypothetical protein